VRGVRDLLELETQKIQQILGTFQLITRKAGYHQITLPSLEESSLYTKSLGDYSDIVTKEMFYIQNKSYVLRPEGTAGAIRSYLMNCLLGEKKLWSYCGSMFRHEKPQNQRYREFYQYGIESISNSFTPASDAEVIILAADILTHLNVPSVLHINTLGDEQARKDYNVLLGEYFQGKTLSKLSENRKQAQKFLRILDSKEEEDQQAISSAPSIIDCLGQREKDYFDEVKIILEKFKIPFLHNPRLVRGLDYYSNVCFEFINTKALIGGGRYDNLAGMVGKEKNMGGIGWAAGIDRICELVQLNEKQKIVGIVPVGSNCVEQCMHVARKIRMESEFIVKMKTEGNSVKQHLGYLKNYEPTFIIFIGEEEINSGCLKLKICATAEHVFVPIKEVFDHPAVTLSKFLLN